MIEGVKNGHGEGTSAVIYLLETTSKVFIPWLEKAVILHGGKDINFDYTQKHGIADAKHSTLALDAFDAEYNFGACKGQFDVYAKYAIVRVENLLEMIFS